MKLFIAISLCAVAVLAFRGERSRYRYDEVEDREVEPFRAGQTYKYRVDTQISNGMASVSDQHAVTRLQADVLLHFQSERKVSLKLDEVQVGTLNHEIQEPEKVQPMEMFKESQVKSEEERQLELPVTFDYADGLVERIRFHQQDQPWSKNIKKSVLNMLQLNLKQRQGQGLELEQLPEWKEEKERENSQNSKTENGPKMFVMPEITLEGECQVTYTVNKQNPSNKFNSYYDNEVNDRDSDSDSLKMFNVTKSVDFHKCGKIADIRYGPKIEKPCKNCTNQQELEERKLDRTTTMRHVVVGNQEKYGIKKVELVSHYIFKMLNAEQDAPMHTIVAGQMNYVRVQEGKNQIESELRQVSNSDKEESLLYSTEWDEKEKLFYMYGDEEFPQNGPFEKIQDKPGKVENLMKKLTGMWSDKTKGIESEATLVYSRLVETLRMCSQEELRQIFSQHEERNSRLSEQDQLKAKDILVDALANAGTHNTIKVLVEKTLRKDIQPARAARAIMQLKDVPAPSEKQVETLTKLCENEVASRHGPLRQVCWLTVGTLVGELCDDQLTVQDAVEQKKPQCPSDFRKKFVAKAMKNQEQQETRYEKIILLKALGNAGLEESAQELEKVIKNNREDPLVRMQAIDSLRRLRAQKPEKVQRILLPVFQNVRERPEVRMMALAQILATIPENPILDQIGFTLIRDPSRQVKSYVYGAMKELSQSPIEVEQEQAEHLKALLKLADITDEDEEALLRGSRYYRIPVYSQAKKEGFFVDFESMVGSDNVLPKHLTAGLDTIFNGLFQKNSAEISLTQEDVEQWFEKLLDVYMDYQYGQQSSMRSSSLRGNRGSSDSSYADNDFRQIVSDLSIKRRSRSQNRVDSDSNNNQSPYAMLSFRYGDNDYAVLPLEEEILPNNLKKILTQGQQPTMRDLEDLADLIQGRPFRVQAALNLLENSVKIPTSAGLPVRVSHVVPVLVSVEGSVKPRMGSEVNVEIQLHPQVSITHLKRAEVWSPIVNSGVETTRTAGINVPLNSKVQVNVQDKSFKWNIHVPQDNFRAFNFHSLPATYTTNSDWTQQRTPVVKRIENQKLVQRAQHIEMTVGKQNFGMPLKISGEVHIPHQASYQDIVTSLMTTENHVNVEFQPNDETPRSIVVSGEANVFQQSQDKDSHRNLQSFYKKSQFDKDMDEYYQDENEDDERHLNRFIDNFSPKKTYNHNVRLQVQTVGGRQEKQAQVELSADCDSQHKYVKAQLKAKRDPLRSLDESSEWTFKAQAQAVLPETHASIQQYKQQQNEKQQRLVAQLQTEWGTNNKQKINVNINGEQARNPEWRQKIQEVERQNNQNSQKLRQQMIQKVAFLNKYDISAEYENIAPETKNAFNQLSTLLKAWNFWNTKTELNTKSGRNGQRDGEIKATIVIDAMTHQHANITLKTPQEIVRIDSLSLPTKVKPFKLVKPGQVQQSIDSFSDMVSSYATEARQECKVDSRKVRSFDDVIFKAPMTKCYSVLAKDCGSENPKFAVLMKKMDQNSQDKQIKVLVRGDSIESFPEDGKLVVKINGRRESNPDTLEEYGVDKTEDLVRIANRDITVRFDGQQASIKVSPSYKNQQCGLCGHYDDDSEDEFRMSNDELTNDIKSYHKSYSQVDDQCREDLEQTHRDQEYKKLKNHREYDEDEESEQRRRNKNDNDEIEPVEKTEVMEYNHKVCFSVKPVKTCPQDSYAQKTKEAKISFTCMNRDSSEARRLLREARRSDRPIDLPDDNKPSFVETITVPSTCVVY